MTYSIKKLVSVVLFIVIATWIEMTCAIIFAPNLLRLPAMKILGADVEIRCEIDTNKKQTFYLASYNLIEERWRSIVPQLDYSLTTDDGVPIDTVRSSGFFNSGEINENFVDAVSVFHIRKINSDKNPVRIILKSNINKHDGFFWVLGTGNFWGFLLALLFFFLINVALCIFWIKRSSKMGRKKNHLTAT